MKNGWNRKMESFEKIRASEINIWTHVQIPVVNFRRGKIKALTFLSYVGMVWDIFWFTN